VDLDLQYYQYLLIVEEQKIKEVKPVKMDGIKKWQIEKILNKRKIREVVKYLVQWKGFIAEYDI